MVDKLFNIVFDILVLPALIIMYLFLYIKIFVELTLAKEKTDISYILYLAKLSLDVAVSEYSLLINSCLVIISSAFYYLLFLIFS